MIPSKAREGSFIYPMKRDILGVVLCGGRSSRMGRDKALIEIRPGESQLDYLLGLLAPFCSGLAASVGPVDNPALKLPEEVACLVDEKGVSGPMAGILAALRSAEGRPILAVACDMPFLESSHLVQLFNRRDPCKLATAFVAEDGKPDPMFVLYEPECLPELAERAERGQASLRRFLMDSEVELVRPSKGCFLASVNDPGQLERARQSFQA